MQSRERRCVFFFAATYLSGRGVRLIKSVVRQCCPSMTFAHDNDIILALETSQHSFQESPKAWWTSQCFRGSYLPTVLQCLPSACTTPVS